MARTVRLPLSDAGGALGAEGRSRRGAGGVVTGAEGRSRCGTGGATTGAAGRLTGGAATEGAAAGFFEMVAGLTGEPKTFAEAGFGASTALGAAALSSGASGNEMVLLLGSPCPQVAATVAD